MDELSISLTGKRWILAPLEGRDGASEDDALAMIEWLRQGRGLDSGEGSFGNTDWHDSSIFPDAAKAAERIERAVRTGEKIGVFGDYDCDGVTSAAQMIRALRRRGSEPIVKLPHRVRDGYGVKPGHIDMFAEEGVKVLVTVDTGVSAHPAIDHAKKVGIDVIILDHHHLLTPPDAYAILHPALAPGFPHPHPSAAGVVFRFLHALEGNTWPERDVDLALALFGTVADLVPLTGHNRTLVKEGLRALRRLPAGPIKTLIETVSPGKMPTSTDVAFRIAPRINAAGRMADPALALKALLEGGPLLKDLDTLNALRQEETSRALEKALTDMVPNAQGELPTFLSVASASYAHGILGLIAGKLTEKHGRPSMAVNIERDVCTASLRSPPGYNIVEALERHAHLFIAFGGHAQAAGATFALEHYVTLTESLEADAVSRIPKEALVPTLAIDAVIDHRAVTHEFCGSLSAMEPFGMGNPEPLFLIENVRLENMRTVGADGKHLQATLGSCKAIGFGLGEYINELSGPVDIACRTGIDTWNGRVTPQLFIQDVRVAMGGSKKTHEKKISSVGLKA